MGPRSDGGMLIYGLFSVEDWYVVCQDCKRWSNLCAVAVDEVAQCREQKTCVANRVSQERNVLSAKQI